MGKPKAIVCDIDGVCLDSSLIFKELFDLKLKGDAKWDYFREHCNGPRVSKIENSRILINNANNCAHIIFSTARNEKCREATEQRLLSDGFFFEKIYMRSQNDYRESKDVKKDHLLEIMKSYDILAFIDDDLTNCEMAKELGILTLRKV